MLRANHPNGTSTNRWSNDAIEKLTALSPLHQQIRNLSSSFYLGSALIDLFTCVPLHWPCFVILVVTPCVLSLVYTYWFPSSIPCSISHVFLWLILTQTGPAVADELRRVPVETLFAEVAVSASGRVSAVDAHAPWLASREFVEFHVEATPPRVVVAVAGWKEVRKGRWFDIFWFSQDAWQITMIMNGFHY